MAEREESIDLTAANIWKAWLAAEEKHLEVLGWRHLACSLVPVHGIIPVTLVELLECN